MENQPLYTRPLNATAEVRPLLQLQNLSIAGGVVDTRRSVPATGKRQHEEGEGPAARNSKRQRVSSRSPSPAAPPELPDFSANGAGRTPTATPGPQFEAGANPLPGNTILTRAARRAQKKQQHRRGQQALRQQQQHPAAVLAPQPTTATAAAQPSSTYPQQQQQQQQPQHVLPTSTMLPFGASAADWNFPTFVPHPAVPAPAEPAPAAAPQATQAVSQLPATVPSADPAPAAAPPAPAVSPEPALQRRRSAAGPARAITPDAAARGRSRAAMTTPTPAAQVDDGGHADTDSSGADSGSNTPVMPQRQLRSGRTLRNARPAAAGAAAAAAPGRACNVILDIMKRQLNMRGRDLSSISLKLHAYSDEQLQLTEGTLQLLLEEDDKEEAINYLQHLP